MTLLRPIDSPQRPFPAAARLNRADVLLVIRRIALDLDADGTGLARLGRILGGQSGQLMHRALTGLVLTLCCHGRRPFVVGHPRNPLPSVAKRHVMALLAAAQRGAGDEVEVRLASLLPVASREQAATDLATVATVLAQAGLPSEPARLSPPRCPG